MMYWRDVAHYPDYEVSDRGDVRLKATKELIAPEQVPSVAVRWAFYMTHPSGLVRLRPARSLVRGAFPELDWDYPTNVKEEIKEE